MKTTLNAIREHSPCKEGWTKLLAHLGETRASDLEVSITTILDSNGLDDALWCLRAVEGHNREIRLYGVWCARQVEHLMTDQRSLTALDVAERFANGAATEAELADARAVAWAAAPEVERYSAGNGAWGAAAAAARDAAWDAAGAAARDAAWDAAGAAARDAAWDAAGDAHAAELRRVCECVERGEDPYPNGTKGVQE